MSTLTPGQAASPADVLASLPRQWEAEASATRNLDYARGLRDCAGELRGLQALAFAVRAGRLGVTDEQGRPLAMACAPGGDENDDE